MKVYDMTRVVIGMLKNPDGHEGQAYEVVVRKPVDGEAFDGKMARICH